MTDEDQRALAVKTVAAVFLSVACVSVILRCYVRGWVVKGFGWDDGSMILAMVSSSIKPTRNREAHQTGLLRHVLWYYDWRHIIWNREEVRTPRRFSTRDCNEGIHPIHSVIMAQLIKNSIGGSVKSPIVLHRSSARYRFASSFCESPSTDSISGSYTSSWS